jgi:hypothetical protein
MSLASFHLPWTSPCRRDLRKEEDAKEEFSFNQK